MAKFRVYANTTQRLFIDVEADTASEAYDKAHEADGGDFTPCSEGNWILEGDIDELEAEK